MQTTLIADRAALEALCTRLAGAPLLALDTEFMRTRTYYARLCLIQVATADTIALIDPLALAAETNGPCAALAPLLEALYAPATLKVLHSARQDLEVLADLFGAPPQPLFDTQLAAALAGFPEQIGYGGLVEALAGVSLAKGHTRTDWQRRPLSAAQLSYATDDVRYLPDLETTLRARLAELGRLGWLEEECARLTDPQLYRNEPATAYRRIAQGRVLAPAQQTVLAALAAWRERTAQQIDRPRNWVVKDPALVELARRRPQRLPELAAIPDLEAAAVRRWGAELLAVAAQADTGAPATPLWEAVERLDRQEQARYQALSAELHAIAERLGVRPAVLATRQELLALLRGRPSLLLQGWRRAVVGEQLAALAAAERDLTLAQS